MEALYTGLAFLFGASFGSFGGVLISRIPNGESVVKPASHCRTCGETLKWWHNLPILGYVLLGGKCAFCKASYGPGYALNELFTGLLFTAAVLINQGALDFKLMGMLALAVVTGPLVVIDLQHHRLPNPLTYFLALAGVVSLLGQVSLQNAWADLPARFGFGLVPAAFLLLLGLISRGGMGLGDVKLAVGLGFVIMPFGGFPLTMAFAVAFLLGGVWATALLVSRKVRVKSHIPFGPFLLIGAWVALGLGDQLRQFTALLGIW